MDIMELGAIGEMVGGVAVLVTLIYLSTQVRQGNEQARREAVLSTAFDFPRYLCTLGDSEETASVLRAGLRDYSALSPVEATRFNSLLLGLYVAFWGVAEAHQAGLIPSDEYKATEANFIRFLREPGGREWWEQTRHIYPERGVAVVQDLLATLDVPPISESWRFFAA